MLALKSQKERGFLLKLESAWAQDLDLLRWQKVIVCLMELTQRFGSPPVRALHSMRGHIINNLQTATSGVSCVRTATCFEDRAHQAHHPYGAEAAEAGPHGLRLLRFAQDRMGFGSGLA